MTRRKKATAEGSSGVSLSQRRRAVGFFLVIEASFLALGWCFALIGNGLVLAIFPLLVAVLGRRSKGQLFERPPWRVLGSLVVVVSLLIGAGVWFLVDLGFEAQNLICMALRS